MHRRSPICLSVLAVVAGLLALPARAQTEPLPAPQGFQAHFQSTWLGQLKPSFDAAYSGPRSLSPARETSYTLSVTAFLGWRPWTGGELYFNPEGVQGRPLSNVRGLGGLTNGEIQKSAGPDMKFYRARLFYRHTLGFGGAQEAVAEEFNQLAGRQDRRRLVFTAGNLSVADLFGTSDIAGDPRSQFTNWSSITYGHFDYAADVRGYSVGGAAELAWDDWSLRAGRFALPRQPNGLQLDGLTRSYGDQLEVERRWGAAGESFDGVAKLLAYRNAARMAAFDDNLAPTCDLALVGTQENCVRRRNHKSGFGVSVEQSFGPMLRLLARTGRSDGRTETYAFTQIDASSFVAARLDGGLWGRAQDEVGLSLAENRLSRAQAAFFAAGGLGVFLGDGALRYRPERLLEAYWRIGLHPALSLSLGLQHIVHPGYNADRGPVNVGTLRLQARY